MKGRMFGMLFMLAVGMHVWAQNTVEIYPDVQRFLNGEVTELDRTVYFNIHGGGDDAEMQKLREDYNVGLGRGFWGAFSYAKSKTKVVGTYPAFRTGNTSVRKVNQYIATEHPANVARYTSVDPVEAGAWAANYYKYWVSDSDRPEYFEPMNEPFVHAGDEVYKEEQADAQLMREHMAKIYKEVGKKFDETPELANMKIIGYSSAWPSVELWDFEHWNTRMKMFMDVAGEYMDAFSTHLYDGINVTGSDNRRSGSNSEALLDLIETYSYAKWGKIVPHAISEFGGIEKGYGDDWNEIASVQSVKSINSIMMGLLEREDRMEICIPFLTAKAEWHITEANNYQPYGAVTWIPAPDQFGKPLLPTNQRKWVYTPRVHFYQMWSDVKGKRVKFKTDNPDIQVQAFADENKLFVILNNLDDVEQEVNLNFSNQLDGFESIRAKRLKIYDQEKPVYTDEVIVFAMPFITLIPGETAVLEYRFTNSLAFGSKISAKDYYSNTHLHHILKDQSMTFSFDNVDLKGEKGSAELFLSIGRKHDKSKKPLVKVNGTELEVPDNWGGYDQANRDDFFGRLEIPVDYQLLGTSNTFTITFPDDGGRISSVILHVEDEKAIEDINAYPNQTPHSIPGTIEAENFDTGGNNVAYFDTDPLVNTGGIYRTGGVDIYLSGENDTALDIQTNEWLRYTVNVEKTGYYSVSLNGSNSNDDSAILLLYGGNNKVSDTLVLMTNAGLSDMTEQSIKIHLVAGKQQLQLNNIYGNAFADKMKFIYLGKDTLGLKPMNKILPPSNTYSVTTDFNLFADYLVKVSLYKNTKLLGSESRTLPGGTKATSLFEINLSELPEGGTDYFWLAEAIDEQTGLIMAKSYAKDIQIIKDYIDSTSLRKSFQNDAPVNLNLSYQTAAERDILVQLLKNQVVIKEQRHIGSTGNISENISFDIGTFPPAGNDYAWRIYMLPSNGDVSEATTEVMLNNVEIVGESASLENAPADTIPNTLYRIDVPYQAFTTRYLILELWKGNTMLASRKEAIVNGSRTKTIPLRLSSLPENGNDYCWKIYIIPTDGSTDTPSYSDSINNVSISDGTGMFFPDRSTLNLYPNPTDGMVFIDNHDSDNTSIKIYNSIGNLLYSSQYRGFYSFDIKAAFGRGIYLLKVSSKNQVKTSRLLVY